MKSKNKFSNEDIKDLLEELYDKYNRKEFILSDPISIPHKYKKKEDIEISGFLSASISWGQRTQIIKNANKLMDIMDHSPYDFIMHAGNEEFYRIRKFYYRTFKAVDLEFFIRVLRSIYTQHIGLEEVFTKAYMDYGNVSSGLISLYKIFLNEKHEKRSIKHIANIQNGSSAKRLNMFLRWMIRKDNRGVDFGLWKSIPASELYIPLDVHSGRTAREFGLLSRKQNDWKAVLELTSTLHKFDVNDPVKYDYALFGASIDKTMKQT